MSGAVAGRVRRRSRERGDRVNRLLILAILAALVMLAGPHTLLVIVFAALAAFDGVMAALIIRRILADLYPLEARP